MCLCAIIFGLGREIRFLIQKKIKYYWNIFNYIIRRGMYSKRKLHFLNIFGNYGKQFDTIVYDMKHKNFQKLGKVEIFKYEKIQI